MVGRQLCSDKQGFIVYNGSVFLPSFVSGFLVISQRLFLFTDKTYFKIGCFTRSFTAFIGGWIDGLDPTKKACPTRAPCGAKKRMKEMDLSLFCTSSPDIRQLHFLCQIKAYGGHWGFYLAYCRGGRGRGSEGRERSKKFDFFCHRFCSTTPPFAAEALAQTWFLKYFS